MNPISIFKRFKRRSPERGKTDGGQQDKPLRKGFSLGIKITHKLTLVVIILVLGFAAVGFTYKRLLDVQDDAAVETARLGDFNIVVEQVQVNLLSARRFEKDFFLDKELRSLERFDAAIAHTKENISKLISLSPDARTKGLVGQVAGVVDQYHISVYAVADTQIAIGLDADSGELGDLRAVDQILDNIIKAHPEPVLERLILQLRLSQQAYLLEERDSHADQVTAAATVIATHLIESKLPKDVLAKFDRTLAEYVRIFQRMVEVTNARRVKSDQVEEAVRELTPLFDDMVKRATATVVSNQEQAGREIVRFKRLFAIVIGAVSAVVILSISLISAGITRSLTRLHGTVTDVAEGKLDARAKMRTRDELGILGNAFDQMLDERVSAENKIRQENDVLNDSIISLLEAVYKLSQRDLTVKIPVKEDVTGPLADSINLLTDETATVLQGVWRISAEVSQVSAQVKTQSDNVIRASAAEQRAVEETVVSLGQSAETMKRIANLAKASNGAAVQAIESTNTAMRTVTKTVTGINAIRETIREAEKRIKRLGERSQEISGVVTLINTIAERTHILALNASMHAASAGEAGRGFAVVANEVQRLAENAREATSEISTLVNNIQVETADTVTTMNEAISQVVSGSELAEQAGQQMSETSNSTAELVAMVEKIAESSRKQALNSIKLNKRAQAIRKSSEQMSGQLQEQSKHTDRLVQSSENLVSAVTVFTLPEDGNVELPATIHPFPSTRKAVINE